MKKELTVGQKVQCIYYHEYPSGKYKAYRRTWISKLIDKPFAPVKLGIIVGDAGIHPFWLAASGGKEQYLFVKFKEYIFAKPIPVSCIQDALEAANHTFELLERNKHRIGLKGYSQDAFDGLSKQANLAKKFNR